MKTLILLSAIPASGKSTWASEYQKSHPNTYIVSSDAIRLELTHGDYHDRSKQAQVWEVFEQRIHEYGSIDNCTVILDALNDLNEIRYKYLSTTPEFDRKIIVLFPNTYERSKKYNDTRPGVAKVPEQALIELYNKFEPLSQEVIDLADEIREVTW